MMDDRLLYLIEKYLDNSASAEELSELEQWYQQQQQKRGPFDHNENAAMQRFRQQVLKTVHANIEQAAVPVIPVRRTMIGWQRVAAAAAVILIIGAVWLLNRTPIQVQPGATQAQGASPVALLVRIDNNTANDSLLVLEDGSKVRLAPNSSLQYEKPFTNNRRILHLRGKAYFKVAKDASRPFVVYSNGIATTALGTAFTITAYTTAAAVKVALHEGRVVVTSADSTRARFLPDTYLTPGQELACNLNKQVYAVQLSAAADTLAKNKTVPLSVGQRAGMQASFEGEPLANVLQQMEKAYHIRLRYRSQEIADMEFSGEIHPADSIGYVLQRIARLYQLNILKKPDGYLIRKDQ